MYHAAKRRIARLLHVGGGRPGIALDGVIAALIVLNVIAVIVGTVDRVDARYGPLLEAFQFVSIGIFSLEYAARVWTAPEHEEYIAFVGLPASILAAGFVEESMLDSETSRGADSEPRTATCPHCGEPIDADDRSGE